MLTIELSLSIVSSAYLCMAVHTNFVGVDPVVGALTITIAKEKDSPSSVSSGRGEFYRALIRTADVQLHQVIAGFDIAGSLH